MKKIVAALAVGMMLGSAVTAVAATNETVQAVFSKFAITVNGQTKELKTDPLVVDGTSYLPVREVANLFGYNVDYEDSTRTIKLFQDMIPARVIVEFIAAKYPDVNHTSFETHTDTLWFADKPYKLQKLENGNYSLDPLIEAGIITKDEALKISTAPTLDK